jgi:hypothetical protein
MGASVGLESFESQKVGRCKDVWVAAYRLLVEEGRLIVAELRVFPAEQDRDAGSWSGELLGDNAKAPRGGLTAR